MYEDAEKDGTVWNILDKDLNQLPPTTTQRLCSFSFLISSEIKSVLLKSSV